MVEHCKNCNQVFEVDFRDAEFYAKIQVSPPSLCPDCRYQRRLAVRNESSLYARKCDLCHKDVIAIYSADKPFKQFCNECFFGDKWDAKDYGRDFDFTRSFFEQFKDLQDSVPRLNTGSLNNVNSEYTNFCSDCKNCYMTIASEKAEDCYYCKLCQTNKNCCDSDYLWDSELCYDCTNIHNCYHCIGLVQSQNCSDCLFSYDLKSCQNCIFCYNLRNQEYSIFNKSYSKEDFEKAKKELKLDTSEGYKKAFHNLRKIFLTDSIHKAADIISCENVSGDSLSHCKNSKLCFDMQDTEECAYCAEGDAKFCLDCNNIYYKPELSYEIMSALQMYNCKTSYYSHYSNNISYCSACYYSSDLFGCISLKREKFCILNKQYSEEEYRAIIPKIIDHMKRTNEYGEFFPIKFSPFEYNETIAMEWCPITREQALEKGYRWREKDIKEYAKPTSKDILACEFCGKNYRLVNQEIQFYKTMQLPTPSLCPGCRHNSRFFFKNPRKIWAQKCSNCSAQIQSTYPPERHQKVFCEACYLKTVI
ncbi:MAG: hypothetical protein WCT36_02225 [Candidatus Gracilibacteria bacterium]